VAVGVWQGDTWGVSRAFVKDQDEDTGVDDIPDRVVSSHRNLVTATGLAQIDEELRRSRDGLTAARGSGDRAEIARHRRDLRYWTERRGSAELVPAPTESDKVRFGSTVTLAPARGEQRTFRIVGEDEASPAEGRISYVSPIAQSLLGGQVGDIVPFGDGDSEIVRIG
jgi:transcription elongation GreA/GreB family factor